MRDDWFSVRRRRTRTVKVWIALSRPCPTGQTDNEQRFSKIRTESGQQTDTGHDFPENPDKNKTRTGHGQCCPPTSARNSERPVTFVHFEIFDSSSNLQPVSLAKYRIYHERSTICKNKQFNFLHNLEKPMVFFVSCQTGRFLLTAKMYTK